MNCRYSVGECDVWVGELRDKGDPYIFVYELCPNCIRRSTPTVRAEE